MLEKTHINKYTFHLFMWKSVTDESLTGLKIWLCFSCWWNSLAITTLLKAFSIADHILIKTSRELEVLRRASKVNIQQEKKTDQDKKILWAFKLENINLKFLFKYFRDTKDRKTG